MPGENQPAPVKGDPIIMIGGTYEGREGWMNDAQNQPRKMKYVILTIDGEEKTRRVSKKNIAKREMPDLFTKAALTQVPKARYHLAMAAFHLAKCGLDDWDEAAAIFKQLGLAAQVDLEAMGANATYYNVMYDPDE